MNLCGTALPGPWSAGLRRRCVQSLAALLLVLAVGAARADELTVAPVEVHLERGARLRHSFAEVQRAGGDLVALRDSLAVTASVLANMSADSAAAVLWHDAGWATFRLGDAATARTYWDRGLELARSSGSRHAESPLLNSVAVGYATAGDLERGIETWSACIELRQELADSLGEAKTWGNLANAYAILGRYPEARFVSAKAAEMNAAVGNYDGVVAGLHREAGMLHQSARLREALVLSDSAVVVCSERELTRLLPEILPRRASIRFDLGDHGGALEDMNRALELGRERGNVRGLIVTEANLAIMMMHAGKAEEALSILDEIFSRPETRGDEILLLQSGVPRARALITLGRIDDARQILDATISRYEELQAETEDPFSKAGLLVRAGAIYSTLAECLHRQGDDAAAWSVVERGCSSVFRGAAGGNSTGTISLPELQDRLTASRSALLQFSEPWGGDFTAYLVTGQSVESIPLPDTDGLIRDARAALRLMSVGSGPDLCRPVLERISGGLLAPVVPRLPGDVERLYVVASAELAGFPFECLPLPEIEGIAGAGTLGDRWPTSYLPGATALRIIEDRPLIARDSGARSGAVRAPGSPAAYPPMLALADPIVAPVEGESLVPNPLRAASAVPLPFARVEIERIAPAGAQVYLGEDARRRELMEGIQRDPSVIHIATHGVIDPANPGRSSLLLAGSPPMVSAGEIESLDVRAELVTLSGCRTLGEYSVLGEGVFGLARSFLLSGSRSVVSSLWDVEDEASARFMELFYTGLRDGLSRDVSLQAARRSLAADGYPYRDWAGFVLTGLGHEPVTALAGSSLATPTSSNRWFLVLALTLVLIFAGWRSRRRPRGPTGSRTGLLLGLLVVVLGGGSFGCSDDDGDALPPEVVDGSSYGLRNLDVRDIFDGQLAPGLIPALSDPVTVAADEAVFLEDDDRVIGVLVNGEARAYPLDILWYHYVVNDVVGGEPIIVTHVPHTGSSVVFAGEFRGERRLFQTTGWFYASNMVFLDATVTEMPDRWVPQMYGVVVQGPAKGTQWPQVPCLEMRWEDWRRLYPDSRVLSIETGYDRAYGVYPLGAGYPEDDGNIMFPLPDFPGSAAAWKDWVLGVGWRGKFEIFLLEDIVSEAVGETGPSTDETLVLSDVVGGCAIAVVVRVHGQGFPSAWVVRREQRGRTFDLELSHVDEQPVLHDPAYGASWSLSGRLMDAGSLENAADLEWIADAYQGFWFAWSVFHLGAEVRDTSG